MPRELDYENLRKCLDNYVAEHLFVRLVGSKGGTVKVSENLEGRMLDAKKYARGLGLVFSLDGTELFRGTALRDDKGFSLEYDREDENGRIIMLPTGIDPYDFRLPEPKRSVLRHVLSDHLVEISFQGMIPLRFHSYIHPDSRHWKYWCIDVD